MSATKIRRDFKLHGTTHAKVIELGKLSYEKWNNWLPSGSGNYEKTSENGNYRETCNSVKLKLRCENDPRERNTKYWHCNKLDCSTCFVTASSVIARKLDERLREFRRIAYYEHGIRVGKILHFSIVLDAEAQNFSTHAKFLYFKKKTIYPMLKDIGIIGGVLFLHLWSRTCTNCNEKYYSCECEEKALEKRIHIHVHVVGFGYLMDLTSFLEKYRTYTYRNHLPRRDNAYYTIFYVLSKVALWRSRNRTLKPSYSLFGFLHPSKFGIVQTHKTQKTENCALCNSPKLIDEVQGEKVRRDVKVLYTIKIKHRFYAIKDVERLRDVVSNKE